jgi:hypothetical protein
MGIGAAIGGLGALVSGGSALAGMFGGTPSQNVPTMSPASFMLPNTADAANQAYSQIGTNLSPYVSAAAGALPQAQTAATSLYNNPYTALMLQGLQGAQGLGYGAANQIYGGGGGLLGQANNLFPMANTVANMGLDPQSALFAQMQQQVRDQANVTNAQYGLSGTPYGAGVANQAMTNFDIAWQNQQLQRAIQGAQAAGGLYGQAGGLYGTGANLLSQAPSLYAQGAQYPFSGYGLAGNQQLGALGSLYNLIGSGQTIGNLPIQDYLQYVGAGQAGQSNALAAQAQQLAQAQAGFNQQMQLGQALGGSLSQLGRIAANPTGWASPTVNLGWGTPWTGTGGGGPWGAGPATS